MNFLRKATEPEARVRIFAPSNAIEPEVHEALSEAAKDPIVIRPIAYYLIFILHAFMSLMFDFTGLDLLVLQYF